MWVACSLPAPELQELFDVLISLSLQHGLAQRVRELILSLPKAWVLQRIEAEAGKYLEDGTDDEYRRFLELYSQLDADLARTLACQAAAHRDRDIREAGEEFLAALGAR